jgi:predicted RNase H-like HicB family nuclease
LRFRRFGLSAIDGRKVPDDMYNDDRTEEIRMKYKVALRNTDEGYSVSVPGLPGCWSQGDTEVEALDNIADAIREYLAVVVEQLEE